MDQTQTGVAAALGGTRKWVRLVSILGFIGSAFMIVAGIGMAVWGSAMPDAAGPFPGGMAVFGLVYVCMALIYLVPSIYLWRYGTHIGAYLRDPQAILLEAALEAQRKFWQFVGVLTVIMLVFMVGGIGLSIVLPVILGGGLPS
jgi:hypothetical protein